MRGGGQIERCDDGRATSTYMSVGGGKRKLLVTESSDLCAETAVDLPLKLDIQRETNTVIPQAQRRQRRRDRHGPLMRRVRLMPLDSPFTYVSQAIYSCICTCRARDVKSLGSREASRRLPSHGAEMRKRVAGPRNKYLRTGTESTSPPAKIPSYTFVFKVHPPLVVRGLIARNPIQFRKD